MKHYCNPMNLPYRYQFYRKRNPQGEQPPFKVYREAADPTLVLFKGVYYLFPSMTAGFFASEDMRDWKFYPLGEDVPVYDYAPDVEPIGDWLYFSASRQGEPCSFYRSRDPRTEGFEEIKGSFPFWDPNLFLDDDGRLYFYHGCSNQTPIYGLELDPETMQPLCGPVELIRADTASRGYERYGEEHVPPKSEAQIEAEVEAMFQGLLASGQPLPASEDEVKANLRGYMGNFPYVEGAYMTRHDGRYYLQYAVPGTEYNVYGNAVCVSEHPLGPFVPAKNNPFSYKPGGFITAAGHGSTLKDKNGNWWHTASMRISHNEAFERRLGLWKAGFDADGELYCDQRFGDWPIAFDAAPFAAPDYMLLSYGKAVTASSGDGAESVTDENIRTFWKAASNAPGEWVCVDLGKACAVNAVQINFGDDDLSLNPPEGARMGGAYYEERWMDPETQPTRWLLEGSTDGSAWTALCDKREVDTDLSHDFLERAGGLELRYLRLTVQSLPYGACATISGIRVFGRAEGDKPSQARNVAVRFNGELDMDVSWSADDAVGAVVLWGFAPDKLYHSRMTYGQNSSRVGALAAGQAVYVRVDTFNGSGIAEGEVIQAR